MGEIPRLGSGLHHRGEHRDTVGIGVFVLEDLRIAVGILGDFGAERLRDTPAGVEQVAHVLDIQAHLQGIADTAHLHDEVMGGLKVEASKTERESDDIAVSRIGMDNEFFNDVTLSDAEYAKRLTEYGLSK